MLQALRISNNYAQYTKKWEQFEQARTAYGKHVAYEDYKESPLWDPAAVLTYQIVVASSAVFCDEVRMQ